MATNKTLAPTNVTIQIPAMTDAPNVSVLANCLDKEADAINALNDNLVNISMSNGTDLNSISATDRTKWYIGADISKMSNIPPTCSGQPWPFTLEVVPLNTGTLYNRQILHTFAPGASAMHMFVRTQTYTNGSVTWSSWMKVSFTVDS